MPILDISNRTATVEVYDPIRKQYQNYECYIHVGCIIPQAGYMDLINNLARGHVVIRVLLSEQEARNVVYNCHRLFYECGDNRRSEWHIPIVLIDGLEYYDSNSDLYIQFTDIDEAVDFCRHVHIDQLGRTR